MLEYALTLAIRLCRRPMRHRVMPPDTRPPPPLPNALPNALPHRLFSVSWWMFCYLAPRIALPVLRLFPLRSPPSPFPFPSLLLTQMYQWEGKCQEANIDA